MENCCHKTKERTKAEQKALREEYLAEVRSQLRPK